MCELFNNDMSFLVVLPIIFHPLIRHFTISLLYQVVTLEENGDSTLGSLSSLTGKLHLPTRAKIGLVSIEYDYI